MKTKFIPVTFAAALLLAAVPALRSENATARLVWSGSPHLDHKAVSPDGRYLAGVDWDTGNLSLYEIATRQTRLLTSEGSWGDSDEYTFRCAWSPDSKQIAYLWCIHALNRNTELRVIGLDGGRPRTLRTATNGWDYTIPHGWTTDGAQILTADQPNEKARLILVSAADGTPREIQMPEGRRWQESPGLGLSPDDKFLLHTSARKVEGKQQINVSVVPMASPSTKAVEDVAEGGCLGWTPDGKGVLFLTKEKDSWTIWLQRLASGKRDGQPQKLKTGSGSLGAMGFTRAGAFYYSIVKNSSNQERIYEVALDPKTSRVISKPSVIVDGLNQTSCSYSPDGQQIAYAFASKGYTLCIRTVATGEERKFPLEVQNLGGGTDRPRWSHDGRFIMMSGNAGRDGQTQTHIMDAGTGKRLHSLAGDSTHNIIASEWSRDGKSIFCLRGRRRSKECQILMRNLETGMEKEIFQSSGTARQPRDLMLMPDGERLRLGRLIVPISGGEPQEISEFRPTATGRPGWSADGNWIFFPAKPTAKEKSELYRVSVTGGDAERLGLPMVGYHTISAHPDGAKLLIAAWETEATMEVWALENLAVQSAATASRGQ